MRASLMLLAAFMALPAAAQSGYGSADPYGSYDAYGQPSYGQSPYGQGGVAAPSTIPNQGPSTAVVPDVQPPAALTPKRKRQATPAASGIDWGGAGGAVYNTYPDPYPDAAPPAPR
ncbi:hypothetical protein [Nevskia sp.]|uniref:hypothetical protein n=1 Tax=Nevskia sp. TaxID=1929292 RepID=UPI0025E01AA3|nr:hypothetical protein [Nevskia sp.]